MDLSHKAAAAVGHALKNVHAGEQKLVSRQVSGETTRALEVTSPSFRGGGPLPLWTTADGDQIPPAIEWSGVPSSTRSLVVICEDPDAPFPKPFVHWIAYGIPATARAVGGASGTRTWKEGKNSKLVVGYTGAAPPPGHGTHRYHFQVFALDREASLDVGAGRGAVIDQLKGHVLAWGEIVGTYERS
jgi:Raf kinase inhibitor-like YbhB/YbcL family protein